MQKMWYYLGGIIFIYCLGFSTFWLINQGISDEYQNTIVSLTERNEQLIELNSKAEEYNKRLKNTVKEFEKLLIGEYRELENGLGMAGDTIEELGVIIESTTLQISNIIETISKLINEIEDI